VESESVIRWLFRDFVEPKLYTSSVKQNAWNPDYTIIYLSLSCACSMIVLGSSFDFVSDRLKRLSTLWLT
jgi:hypothetical protein